MKYKLIPTIVMFLLIIPLAHSLGVTPGRTRLHFKENLEEEIKFTILNNEQKDLKLAIYARGILEDYIEIPIKEVQLKPEETEKGLTYKIKLPEEVEEPGLYGTEIVVREITVGEGEDIVISAMQAVVTQLHVYVPYPGKYIVAKLDIVGGRMDKNILFFVPLINFGEEDVKSAKAEIIIMDMQGNIIHRVETNEKAVPAKGRAELSAQIDPSPLPPGISRVIAKVTYDGLTTTAENSFYVKDFFLIPLDISVRDFTLGDIAKFNILVENIANIDIKGADSLMLFNTKEGSNIANLKSVPTDFKPLEKKEMISYWDTKDVKEDEYTGKIILRYEDKTNERNIRTLVSKTSIKTEIIGITGYAISEQLEPTTSYSPTLIIIIALLVMANLGWFAFYLRSKKRK